MRSHVLNQSGDNWRLGEVDFTGEDILFWPWRVTAARGLQRLRAFLGHLLPLPRQVPEDRYR